MHYPYVLFAFLCLAFSAVFPVSVKNSQKTSHIEGLSREACALAWDSDDGETARCVERVMAAMVQDQGIRNNELMRRLGQVETDLRLCKELRE